MVVPALQLVNHSRLRAGGYAVRLGTVLRLYEVLTGVQEIALALESCDMCSPWKDCRWLCHANICRVHI